MLHDFVAALLLAGLAGMATSLGAILGVLGRPPGRKTLALSMGFSAGVMVMVSFTCMLVEAQDVIGQGWTFAALHCRPGGHAGPGHHRTPRILGRALSGVGERSRHGC